MAEQVNDASVAVRWVIKDDSPHTKSLELLYTTRQNDIALIAPPLFEYEIESVLQRYLNLDVCRFRRLMKRSSLFKV